MTSELYDWSRFWYRIADNINLDYQGFLEDPESDYGYLSNPNAVSLSQISHIPCLVLLGEAGMGKTTTIEQEYTRLKNSINPADNVVLLFFRLGDYISDQELHDEIFKSQKFQSWLNGNQILYLFLDSLDEGLLSTKKLLKILGREIGKGNVPHDRFFFRISCRTSEWLERASILEVIMKEKWKPENVGIYQLAPLRKADIKIAVECKNINFDIFLEQVFNKNAVAFAIKPVTLKFLMNLVEHQGQLPALQKDLYEQGCLQLCEEVNRDRRATGETGTLTGNKRLTVASQIAALMIFSNKIAIWTNRELGQIPPSDIAIQDIEKSIDQEFNKRCILEVLSVTGLFSSRGNHRIGFAHRTYAEFLAARYLIRRNVLPVQIMSLLVSPEAPDSKLIPQLHETAAWLASMSKDIFQIITKTDPDVILRSDVPTDDLTRQQIVNQLLQQYEGEKLIEYTEGIYRPEYKKLYHSELAEQLRRYIWDNTKNINTRNVAIDIAKICEIRDLQQDLVNLALNSLQPIQLRVNAVSALCLIGDNNSRRQLEPLAVDDLGEDENDQLKGLTLTDLWPDLLTAQDLFAIITPPKRGDYVGSYQIFLNHKLAENLQPQDMLVALNWVKQQGQRFPGHPFESLADTIFLKAWEYLECPEVSDAFADLALTQWMGHQKLITLSSTFEKSLYDDDNRRRLLLSKVVIKFAQSKIEASLILSVSSDNIVLNRDLFWMIEKAQIAIELEKRVWSKLILWHFNREDAAEIDALLTAMQNDNILAEEFELLFGAIELDSERAGDMKANYKLENHSQNLPALAPPPQERVILLLERLEHGELEAWTRLNREMTLRENSRYYDNRFDWETDLTKLPGWEEASPVTRQRIIDGANQYIKQKSEEAAIYSPINTSQYTYEDLAICRAFQLLLKEHPPLLNDFSPDIWDRWVPAIINHPNHTSRDECYLELFNLSYRNSPVRTIETLLSIIDRENQESESILIINQFKKCWDENLKTVLLDKAQDPELKPQCMGCLLEKLLELNFDEAREYAQSLITLPPPSEGISRQRAIIAAKALLKDAVPLNWSIVWSVIQENANFGKEVIELVVNGHSKGISLNLTERQLTDLYIWLVRQYPFDEDPRHYSSSIFASDVSLRDCIARFRDGVLAQLKYKGTSQSCMEIQRIAETFPEIEGFKQTLLQAYNIRRSKAWIPPTIPDILEIVNDNEKRFVSDGNQLLDVLIEAFKKLELKLQGETPAARDVWDKQKENLYKPVSENEFSDYVKRFLDDNLKQRGIIVNREVELRPSTGGRSGERTDIQVDAISNGDIPDCITVIIEVKGNWHGELITAMETQLVNRYLQDNTCRHGIYLVGWFECPQWDQGDPRYKKYKRLPPINLEEVKKQFDEQAKNLCSENMKVRAFVLNAALR